MKFSEFDLDPRCLRVLDGMNIDTPTPVQDQSIPVALEGKDVIATAQTGTGKTLGYLLPSLTRLAEGPTGRNRMLVMAPTRELVQQVYGVAEILCKALHLRCTCIYGGVGMQPQIDDLKHGCDVLIATPGRLLDHMGRGRIRFTEMEILVLDEADRMLDMGFLPDIRRILQKLPTDRQTMMYSATFADELNMLVAQMMRDPERIAVGMVSKPVDKVRQILVPVRPEEKAQKLLDILEEENIDSAIVFLRTKNRTHRVGKMLHKSRFNTAFIHGDLSQSQRQKSLDGFRSGKYQILVATDVAARGLDVESVSHVINYDIPTNADDYIHRIGRTARAEREGDAITFVCPNEYNELEAVERAIGRNLPRKEYPGAPAILSTWHPPGSKTGPVRRAGAVRKVKRGLLRRR
jgi:ATP-dependent RNA helicase RhlE